jgi:hypothetical protein
MFYLYHRSQLSASGLAAKSAERHSERQYPVRQRGMRELCESLQPGDKLPHQRNHPPRCKSGWAAMATSKVAPTIGELFFAIVLASIAAVLAGISGFVLGIFLCGRFLSGEATESALVVGPTAALLFGSAAFALVFRWIVHYGDPTK